MTPVYDGADLLAWGVQMEAYSVEDQGAGVCFNVLCFNAEPGVAIDYATGASWADEGVGKGTSPAAEGEAPEMTYVLNTSSMKFHLPDCAGAARIAPQNRTGDHGLPSGPSGPGVYAVRQLRPVKGGKHVPQSGEKRHSGGSVCSH